MTKRENLAKQQLISYQIQQYLTINHRHLLSIYEIQNHDENSTFNCVSDSPTNISFFTEWYPNNLYTELQHHYPATFFSEDQLWDIIKSVVSAMAILNNHSIAHYDLRPQNIQRSNQGEYKIFPLGLISNSIGIGKSLKHSDRCYLSPEEFLAIYLKQPHLIDHSKADVFSFGMTMLSLACLNSLDSCYSYENLQIYQDQIDKFLVSIQNKYSGQLINIIKQMIIYDTDMRPSFTLLQISANQQPQVFCLQLLIKQLNKKVEQELIQQPMHVQYYPPRQQYQPPPQLIQQPVQHLYSVQPIQPVQPLQHRQPVQQIVNNPEPLHQSEKIIYTREPPKLIMAPQGNQKDQERFYEVKSQLEQAPIYQIPMFEKQSHYQQIPEFNQVYNTSDNFGKLSNTREYNSMGNPVERNSQPREYQTYQPNAQSRYF